MNDFEKEFSKRLENKNAETLKTDRLYQVVTLNKLNEILNILEDKSK